MRSMPWTEIFVGMVTFGVAVIVPLSQKEPIEWLLDLDDNENFASHPLIHFVMSQPYADWHAPRMLAALRIAGTPILGVLEPISALLRTACALFVGNTPASMFVVGCMVHSFNTLKLFSILRILHDHLWLLGLSLDCRDSFAVAGSMSWALHPLRGEVLGWLSCQSYLFATAFSFAACESLLRADTTSRWPPISSVLYFSLACGCKAVVVTLPAAFIAIHLYVAGLEMKRVMHGPTITNERGNVRRWAKLTVRTVFRYCVHLSIAIVTVMCTRSANSPREVGIAAAEGVSAESVRTSKSCAIFSSNLSCWLLLARAYSGPLRD
jgi:hypothetical protein